MRSWWKGMEYKEEIEKVYKDQDIVRYLKSKLPPQEVEEVLQESVMKLLKVKNKENIRNWKNYFFIIVKSKVADYYKSRVRTDELQEGDIFTEGVDDFELLLKDYPLLYSKYKGYGWRESGYSERYYYKKLKREKEKLYEDLCE